MIRLWLAGVVGLALVLIQSARALAVSPSPSSGDYTACSNMASAASCNAVPDMQMGAVLSRLDMMIFLGELAFGLAFALSVVWAFWRVLRRLSPVWRA